MRKMKDSGIPWIGQIPADWDLIRFKDKYTSKKEIAGIRSSEYQRLALTLNGVIRRPKDDSEGLQPKDFDTYQILRENEFIFKMIDLQNVSTSRVGLSPYTGLVSPAYIKFVPRCNNQFPRFIYYFLMSMYYNCVFNKLGGDGVRSALNASDMGVLSIPYPSLQEQKAIVKRIEDQVTKIEALIANQQEQIEKLKQYKQSLITEVVTKGLDPNAPMKDSGVEWIGRITENHRICRLKFLLSVPMMYGANESGSSNPNYMIRYIRITDITSDGKLKNDENNLYLSYDVAKDFMLKDKDILFARSGGTVGKSFIYYYEYGESAFAGYLIKAECDQNLLLPEYLHYYTQSSLYEQWKNMIFIQSTIQNIGANKYSNMEIVLPSVEEQQPIVDCIKSITSMIDRIIDIKIMRIEKLNDYKKSLIYEYVTGKKEVL